MTIRQQNLFLLVIGVVYFLSHHQNVIIVASAKARTWLKQKDTVSIMNGLQVLTQHGRVLDVLAFCDEIEDEFGTLAIEPNISPSIYTYKGVALYQLQRMNDSEKQFLTAISKNPNETRAWINLGEIQVQTFRLTESIHSFEKAFLLGDLTTLPRIVRAKGWSMDWKDFEIYASDLEKHATICTHDPRKCLIDSSGGFEYTDASGEEFLLMQKASPHAVPGKDPIEKRFLAPYWPISEYGRKQRTEKRLKLGFVSSDFGVHPVSNLIRGMLHFLDKSKFEVYCFSLHPELSWWGLNISTQVEHFIPLPKTNIRDGSALIASFQIEILIELNGHTLNSGLNLLSYRPAPVQMTYLGLPTSAGATFVDYFIGDYVALPAEHRQAFSEHLVLMKPCYISNDYAQVQGDILEMPQAARTELIEHSNILNATILLGTLSNSQKVDPDTFHTWMNIMRRFAGSKMLFMQYAGAKYYVPNIAKQAQLHGISLERIFSRPQIQWIDHLYAKSALDLVLDTRVKNGHTTGLDGVWAGVPTLTFGGGKDMQSRAGQSIAASLDSDIGVAFSLKEYEDIAISLLRNKKLDPRLKRKVDKALKAAAAKLNSDSSRQDKSPTTEGANEESTKIALDAFTKADLMASVPSYERLKKWREKVGSLRNSSYLFDSRKWTKSLEHLMEASWEIYNIYSKNNWKPFHIFSRTELPEYDSSTHFPVGQIYSQGSKYFNRPGNNIDEAVQAAERKFNNNQPQQLHKVHIHSTDHIMEVERSGEVDNDNDSAGIDEARLKLTAPKKKAKKSYVPIPKYVFDGRLLLLNIGKCYLVFIKYPLQVAIYNFVIMAR